MNALATAASRRVGLIVAVMGLLGISLQTAAQDAPRVRFATSAGDFVVEVYPDKAPKTAENFLQYVKDRHYDGTVFHRVINNFMIQGGGYDVKYDQKTTRAAIAHEGREALAKGLKNETGMLAMARTNNPHSASSQFFINVKDNVFLDPTPQSYGYTVFGKVVAGMDVVEKIKTSPTGPAGPFASDVPKTPIIVNSATLVK